LRPPPPPSPEPHGATSENIRSLGRDLLVDESLERFGQRDGDRGHGGLQEGPNPIGYDLFSIHERQVEGDGEMTVEIKGFECEKPGQARETGNA